MTLGVGAIVSDLISPVTSLLGQTSAPTIDAQALGKTGSVDVIVSFISDHPDQRGVIETTMAASGRIGDLSVVIDRIPVAHASVTLADGAPSATLSVTSGTTIVTTATAAGGVVTSLVVTEPGQRLAVGLPITTAGDGRQFGSGLTTANATTTSATMAGTTATSTGDVKPASIVGNGASSTINPAVVVAAVRAETLPQLILTAVQDGRLGALVTAARDSGLLPQLAVAARSMDVTLAAFAARGGLSVTEVALMVRTGMLADPAATLTRTPTALDPATALFAPRDGLSETNFVSQPAGIDEVAVTGATDAALARFESGGIRIVSREAVDLYGVLGPPASLVIPADAFEGSIRNASGDLAIVEAELGLGSGVLTAPETLVAFIACNDLPNLRLRPDNAPGFADWRPGGERSGPMAAGFADLHLGSAFREVIFSPELR